MAKLTKHAEVLDQLHSMVKKQAEEAQKNISGAPGGDVKSVSVGDEHENHNKNSVGPENVAQGYHQKPSDDPAEPLAKAKTANDLGAEILSLIRKQAEAQDSVSGKPGDVKSESVADDKEKVNKNSVKPENNKQDYSQKDSTDSSKPLAETKKAEVEELAAKVASYDLGRQFCAALLKAAGEQASTETYDPYLVKQAEELELVKQAGRRDFDTMIAQAAEELETQQKQAALYEEQEKQAAERAGAAYFDELVKQSALQEAIEENTQLTAKLAEYENFFKSLEAEQATKQAQETLATSVAETVLNKLKTVAAE
jgi:hypothetical protein